MDRLLARAKTARVRARGMLLEGVAHEQIVRAAKRQRADMIVMGTHGRTGMARFFLGSVAARVAADSLVPRADRARTLLMSLAIETARPGRVPRWRLRRAGRDGRTALARRREPVEDPKGFGYGNRSRSNAGWAAVSARSS